jgi:hypothetical protein
MTGEIAEMMLDGTLCAVCGVALVESADDEPAGFPQYCSEQCARDHGVDVAGDDEEFSLPGARSVHQSNKSNVGINRTKKKFRCQKCNKGFRSASALVQHERDAHGTSGFRLERTGRTVAFDDVQINGVFFADGRYFVKYDSTSGMSLRGSSEQPTDEAINFFDCDGDVVNKTVEAVIVEGNAPA